jgi:hypothetical protein
VLRFFEMTPGLISSTCRTAGLDYGVVLESEITLVMDNGAERIPKRSDIAAQRGMMHVWRNCSETDLSRIMYVPRRRHPWARGRSCMPARILAVGWREEF